MPKAFSCFQLILFLQIICSASSAVAVSKLIPGNNDTDFEKQVAPILIKRCVECHHSDDPNGGLNLTSDQGFRTGGESAANLLNQNLDENLLIEKISSGEMPPPENGISKELTAAEKKTLKAWIQQGSHWPKQRVLNLYEFTNEIRGGRDWWSFQPIQKPKVPVSGDFRNPIDALIAEKQRPQGLQFSRRAPRNLLFRRVVFDVTGLPPNFTESTAFQNDDTPGAYENLVDRLLNSPRFGEHFGRVWLDLVRYGDTNGYERDAEKPNSWKYRDWVIESLNSDKPYDQFVTQQLAGDQMVPITEDNVIGTTMLRLGTWDDEPNDKLEYKYDRLEDLIHVTSTAFLGLTVKCARCHNHKFDPIPQTDYYRFGSIFWPGDLIGNAAVQVKGFDVFGWTDTQNEISPIQLLEKGNPRKPTQKLEPGFLSVVAELDTHFASPHEPSSGTGRRLEFAKRLTDSRNPLLARVIVNRIWQHYFGEGIVRTPNNFGYKGDRPTHPELLDWLASELIENEWSLKAIHRLILTSRTYRQDSGSIRNSKERKPTGHSGESVDPLNFHLSRMNRKRLRAEAIRDTFLSHSGQLNLEMGGRGFTPNVSEDALDGLSRRSSAWRSSSADQRSRRGTYLFIKRSLIPPLIANFDFADSTRPCGQRNLTIVAPQALALLNNQFIHQQSELFAHSLMKQSTQLDTQIRLAWNRAYCREPSAVEQAAALQHYHQQLAYFSDLKRKRSSQNRAAQDGIPTNQLALHLDATSNVETDPQNRVIRWTDKSQRRSAAAITAQKRPVLVGNKVDGKSVIEFNGIDQVLELNDQVLNSREYTIVLVGHDENPSGNREFFSNWNANGNSTSSVFLGLTDGRKVRFSDQFRSQGTVPEKPFILTAVSKQNAAQIYAGRHLIGNRSSGLSGRKLDTKYVIGTQGNFGAEFQDGWLAELLVFNRGLSNTELEGVWTVLEKKYPSVKTKVNTSIQSIPRTPQLLALSSLCHVLLNSNEAIFVD
ncbi:MAG: PSD1 and planctomycete cytochrome C domain-containing protein [Planctomycetota bacterium]|nr:PSD1 and planctomycete cytochrome C domain-containing protein [Planctomycetota bacterium]